MLHYFLYLPTPPPPPHFSLLSLSPLHVSPSSLFLILTAYTANGYELHYQVIEIESFISTLLPLPLPPSLPPSLPHSLPHSLPPSLTPSLLPHSLTASLTSLPLFLPHSIPPSLPHSLTHPPPSLPGQLPLSLTPYVGAAAVSPRHGKLHGRRPNRLCRIRLPLVCGLR